MSEPWPIQTLAELAADEPNSITDGPFGSKLKSEHYAEHGPRVIRLQNIGDATFVDAQAHISEGHYSTLQKHRVFPGDIVIAALGENPPRSCLVPESLGPAIVKADCIRFKAGARILPKFLNYVLNAPDLRNHAKGIIHGVGRPRLNLGEIKALPIPVPPLPEQRRIVVEIEKQFTRLEAGVAALRRVQANLKRYRAAVLKAACEGRLVSTEAELAKAGNRNAQFETGEALLARILTERRDWFYRQQENARTKKKYIEPARPETTNLPSLPDGWSWGTWNQLSNWVTYGFTRPMPHVDDGIPIVTAKSVNRGRIDFEGADLTTKDAYEMLSEKDRPQPGDILITKDGTIGRAAVVNTEREFCINQSVAVVWLRSCPMEPKFLLAVIESELTQRPIWAKARGVAIQHLSITDFAKMAIPLPPLAEQTRIVAEVERRLSVVEELEGVVSANLRRATRLRQAILQRAFEGRLVEPASSVA